MMKRLSNSSAIRKAGLFAVALILSSVTAFAGTMKVNLPKSDWVIGPINARSTSGVGYCSMKDDYSDGNTLVFARDAEGSNSLAIDFHKKVMEPGGQYLVSLRVGALQRDMMAIAATPSIFIIQMGLDTDFYSLLQRRANLLVDFQRSKMAFKLDGTKDGLAALTKCAIAVGSHRKFAEMRVPLKNAVDEDMAAVEPAAGSDTPLLPAPINEAQQAPGPQAEPVTGPTSGVVMGSLGQEAVKATLEEQIAALKNENRRLLAENQRVTESLAATAPASGEDTGMLPEPAEPSFTNDPAAPATDVTAALTQAQQDIQQRQAELASKQAALEAANAQLKAQLQAAQVQAEEQRREAALEAENARLKAQLAEAQTAKAVAPQPVPAASPAPKVRILAEGGDFLPALLAQSNIESRRRADGYLWHADGIRGTAQEEKLGSKGLEDAVNDYVSRHAKSCRGDFAHTTRAVKTAEDAQAMEAELACIHKNGHGDAASAVLFVVHDGRFDIISQAGTPDSMEKALSTRDAMVAAIAE